MTTPHERLHALLAQIEDAAVACAAVPATWHQFKRDDKLTWPPEHLFVLVWLNETVTYAKLYDANESKWSVKATEFSQGHIGRYEGILWCYSPQPPENMTKDYPW